MSLTNLDINTRALRALRRRSEVEDRSSGAIASELILQADSARSLGESESPRFELPTHQMGEPLVDIEDKEALRAALESMSPTRTS